MAAGRRIHWSLGPRRPVPAADRQTGHMLSLHAGLLIVGGSSRFARGKQGPCPAAAPLVALLATVEGAVPWPWRLPAESCRRLCGEVRNRPPLV